MPELVLGPLLRRVGRHGATLFVETDRACEVEVLGRRERTFHIEGHHYALLHVGGLVPGEERPYEVALDGTRCWPREGSDLPPSTIRPWREGEPFHLLFGTCHQAAPHRAPWNLPLRDDDRGLGADALHGWARLLAAGEVPRPDALFLGGDQVYADETHPLVAGALEDRRGHPPPPGWPQVTSFEEYTWLYREAWSPPLVRWLLSCIPFVSVFDDHDIIDDWNTSADWRRRIERVPWWEGRIHGGLMAYWLYQHLGNVAPDERDDEDLLEQIRAAGDGGPLLRSFARRADAGTPGDVGHRWSYRRDLGPCRLVVVDSRNGRVLREGDRSMLDGEEWRWLERQAQGDVDHLLIGTSLPWLLPRSIHDLEAWDEQVAGGAWTRWAGPLGERIRRAVDLEHWAAFGRSFERLSGLILSVARGERGRAPATVLVLSGDLHFAYVAEPELPGVVSRVRQVVSSPIRQAVPMFERRVQRLLMARPLSLLARALARATPGARPRFRWDLVEGPYFQDNISLLTFDGSTARLQLHLSSADDEGRPRLDLVLDREL